jgi:PTH1 family peptidyl-tRNA hydrolase
VGFRTVEVVAQRYGERFKKPLLKHYQLARVHLTLAGSGELGTGLASAHCSQTNFPRKDYPRTNTPAGGSRLFLVKPLTYMNNSGQIFPEILKRTGADLKSLLIVCDTMDLPVGQCRLKRKGSAGGQKGLASIIRRLGSEEFPRLFIGIGRPLYRQDVVDYVLSEPRGKQAAALEDAVQVAADGVIQLAEQGLEKVMNDFNRRVED